IYVADSESESVSRNHDGWKRGIRVGSAKTGAVTAFIPDPVEKTTGTSAAEGVAADAMGNIYGAEVGPKRLMRYVKNCACEFHTDRAQRQRRSSRATLVHGHAPSPPENLARALQHRLRHIECLLHGPEHLVAAADVELGVDLPGVGQEVRI